ARRGGGQGARAGGGAGRRVPLPVASDPRGHPPPRADRARGAPADRAEARVTDDHMGEAVTEPCVTTRHAIDLPGGRLGYQARAGTVRVGRGAGSPPAGGVGTEPGVAPRRAIDLPGGRLEYQARAGTVRVGRDDGSPLADVFYLA